MHQLVLTALQFALPRSSLLVGGGQSTWFVTVTVTVTVTVKVTVKVTVTVTVTVTVMVTVTDMVTVAEYFILAVL
jgi:hypothetical protein